MGVGNQTNRCRVEKGGRSFQNDNIYRIYQNRVRLKAKLKSSRKLKKQYDRILVLNEKSLLRKTSNQEYALIRSVSKVYGRHDSSITKKSKREKEPL